MIIARKVASVVGICLFLLVCHNAAAGASQKLLVTVLTASNQGSDFNLDNDAYRDKLIQLFSYTSYDQVDQSLIYLDKTERKTVALTEGYELTLTLQREEGDRVLVQATIRKGTTQYVNTVLSIMKNGVAFLGGPSTSQGVLILVLERF